jgi:hypothetical protein
MKRIVIALIVAGVACAGLYWRRAAQALVESRPSALASEPMPTHERANQAPVQEAQASAKLAPAPEPEAEPVDEDVPAPVQLTPSEQALVGMYEAMAQAIDANGADCAAMARSLTGLTKVHADEVKRWSAEQEQLDQAQRQEAASRVQTIAGATTARFRQSLQRGLSSCASDPSLLAAVGQLGALARTP